MTVLKFGGSSVADPARMREVARRVRSEMDRGFRVAVVVSAMGKTTDRLISLARDVNVRLDGRELDQLLATGEQQSVALLALALKAEGVMAQSFTAPQAGFKAVGFPMEGRIYRVDAQEVEETLANGVVPVVTGFQAVTDRGDLITLGRGGSDLSAVALAAALGAHSCQILKDVAGIMSADPRVVRGARKLKVLSYEECMEMSALGAKMLQARSVEMAMRYQVPLYVGSSFTDEEEGTWVMSNPVSEGLVIRAVVHDTNVAKITVIGAPDMPGVAARLFRSLERRGIGAEMIVQNTMRGGLTDMTFLVKKSSLDDAIDVTQEFCSQVDAQGVSFDSEVARVSVVGACMANHPELPVRMFETLAEEGINIDMISSNALSLTCVLSADRCEDAVRALHEAFVEEASF